MTKNIKSSEQSTEILKKTIHFIGQLQLAAIPVNYTVCYEYFCGGHPSLNQTIDKAITDQLPITNDVMQQWFDTFLYGYDLIELNQSQTELFRIANQLAVITAQAEGNVSQFDNSLNDCKSELDQTVDNSSLSSVVSMLLISTSSMQVAMEQMKSEINTSKQEIASLQDRLDVASIEALVDHLTGLTNRKGLIAAIDEALTTAGETENYPCLLMLDIDFFKNINDTYGHLLGDRAIKLVADTLRNQIKGKDTAARYGGEEFAVLLPETEMQNAWTVAENIRRAVEKIRIKRKDDQQEICRITVSIGITRYQPDESITDFIEHSDIAMYQSKNTGRNRTTIFEAQPLKS